MFVQPLTINSGRGDVAQTAGVLHVAVSTRGVRQTVWPSVRSKAARKPFFIPSHCTKVRPPKITGELANPQSQSSTFFERWSA